jgi:hypothetical protein
MSGFNPPLPVPISQTGNLVTFAPDLLFPVAVPGTTAPAAIYGRELPGYFSPGTPALTIITVPLTTADLLSTFSVPLVLAPAPGVGMAFAFAWSFYDFLAGSLPYVVGDTGPQIWFGTAVGTAFDALALGTMFAGTTNQIVQGSISLTSPTSRAGIENQPLILASPASDMTNGNGTATLTIACSVVTLST